VRNDGCFEDALQAAEMTQAMRSMRMVADRREVAQGAPASHAMARVLRDVDRSTGCSVFSTDTLVAPNCRRQRRTSV
jgi:hypothetical protein